MSGMNLGKAQIDIVAENQDLRQKLTEAEAALQKFESAGSKSGKGFIDSMRAASRSIKDLAGALLAIPGAAAAGFAAGRKLRDLFNLDDANLVETMKAFENIDFKKPEEALKSLNAQMKELQHIASASEGSLLDQLDAFFRGDSQGIQDRIEYVNGLIRTAEANRIHEQVEAEKKAQAERYAAFRATSDKILADQKKAADAEQDRLMEEYAQAVDDEMQHREWLKEQAEKAHKEELDRIADREKAQLDSLKRIEDEMARIRREQEAGFGIGNINFGNGGAAASSNLMLRARIGRGNGRF